MKTGLAMKNHLKTVDITQHYWCTKMGSFCFLGIYALEFSEFIQMMRNTGFKDEEKST